MDNKLDQEFSLATHLEYTFFTLSCTAFVLYAPRNQIACELDLTQNDLAYAYKTKDVLGAIWPAVKELEEEVLDDLRRYKKRIHEYASDPNEQLSP